MSSHAERYAAFRRRQGTSSAAIEAFQGLYGFEFDPFQIRACKALESGDGVLVATGRIPNSDELAVERTGRWNCCRKRLERAVRE